MFGTPSLLLLGYSFEDTLYYVLPSSLVISILQTWHDRASLTGFKYEFFLYSLPPLICVLSYILLSGHQFEATLSIGILLLCFSLMRLFSGLHRKVRTLLERHRKIFLMLMGTLHGATNLGGALLNIYVNGIFHDKKSIRVHIAYAYSTFVILQLIILLLTTIESFDGSLLFSFVVFPLMSAIVFIIPGNKLFVKTSNFMYFHAMTVLMAVLGVLLILRS